MMTIDGTLLHPFTLPAGLGASAWVHGGQTLYLLDGTMTSDASIPLFGTNGAPVTVRPYGNAAKLNGEIAVSGDYLVIRDLEIFWDGWTGRESALSGSDPADLVRKELGGTGKYIKFINCVMHDFGLVYFDDMCEGLEFYGCVIYYNGWRGPDRGHGHGLYLHNLLPTMTVKDCIIFDNFGWGIHAYSPMGANLKYFEFRGNTVFCNGSLSGTLNPGILLGADSGQADTATIAENMTYGNKVGYGLHFYGAGAANVTLTDNYIPEGKTGTYTAVVESGNTYGTVGNVVFVRQNAYDPNRANLTIYNQTQANTVAVDVSAVFGQTGTVHARNVQDYFVDLQTLTITSGLVAVNMQTINRTVAAPVQWLAPLSTFPTFGCFILEKQ